MSKTRLWHIPVSHYNEKVRWALDLKGVDHDRRAPLPGPHMAYAMWLTRGRSKTFPVLELDGRGIGDSTAIIAALEERFPDPPLYPADPAERRRALELEDFFDEELAPYTRQLAFGHLRGDAAGFEQFTAGMLPDAVASNGVVRRAVAGSGKVFTGIRYRAAREEERWLCEDKIVMALDRLEAELAEGGGEYLVGDAFSVADLTAASLFMPIVLPPEGTKIPAMPAAYEEFRLPLCERPGGRWVSGIFARHRRDARRP